MWFFITFLLNILLLYGIYQISIVPMWLYILIVLLLWIYIPRESYTFRSLSLWKQLFNVKIHNKPKESHQCIYAVHPHGVFSVSTIAGFVLNDEFLHVKVIGSSVLFWLFGISLFGVIW